jgi:hypothetical protein
MPPKVEAEEIKVKCQDVHFTMFRAVHAESIEGMTGTCSSGSRCAVRMRCHPSSNIQTELSETKEESGETGELHQTSTKKRCVPFEKSSTLVFQPREHAACTQHKLDVGVSVIETFALVAENEHEDTRD